MTMKKKTKMKATRRNEEKVPILEITAPSKVYAIIELYSFENHSPMGARVQDPVWHLFHSPFQSISLALARSLSSLQCFSHNEFLGSVGK